MTASRIANCILKINIDEQDRLGRTASDSTIEWWGKQDPKAMEEAFDQTGAVSVEEALRQVSKWAVGVDTIWGQGYGFDLTIMEDMYRMLGVYLFRGTFGKSKMHVHFLGAVR